MTDATTWYEIAQAWIAAATLPITLAFLILFMRPSERWWATWFGWSLLLLALGVFSYSLATVLYRFLGDYPGRPAVLIGSTILVFLAMAIRTVVLWRTQRGHHRGHSSLSDALAVVDVVREFEIAVARIEALEPCPNPECNFERSELIRIARKLPSHRRH